jgi:hydroxymethylpyrimidine pyrophosphatase-like HAD family hydrolase
VKLAVLALDYDGTVARHDRLDAHVREAIADARTRGIVVLIDAIRARYDLTEDEAA